MNHFIIQTAAAHMPAKCWGKYRRIAIIEVTSGVERVSMISDRAKGVVRVVRTWERLFSGTTDRCAYRRALAEATDYLATLVQS